jgi:hypothetical protein
MGRQVIARAFDGLDVAIPRAGANGRMIRRRLTERLRRRRRAVLPASSAAREKAAPAESLPGAADNRADACASIP